jgi:hypothetical protein
MKWVTRSRVRLDRCACAWLIQRHIDPQAEIYYLDGEELAQAIGEGALPFHNTVSEAPGLDERTSFDMLLAEYKLDQTNPALALMDELIHAAETKEPGAPNDAEGVRAIAKGMNALAQDDEDMVRRMLPVFDALYVYCARRVQGRRGWANEVQEPPIVAGAET